MPSNPADHLRRFGQRIARHRFINWTTSVHTRVDIEMNAADAFLKESGLDQGDPPVTREHLWLCAAARVLRERPLFNVDFDGIAVLKAHREINLRVSISPGGRLAWGVIERADQLSPAGMAQAHQAICNNPQAVEYVEQPMRRRPGRLGRLVDDVLDTVIDVAPFLEHRMGLSPGGEAGTFTVLNAGAFGAEDLHTVLLRPAIAQLVIMKPRQQLEKGSAGPELRTRVPMAAPFCHKLMDTDAAAYFLHHMQSLLDDPARNLLGPEEAQS